VLAGARIIACNEAAVRFGGFRGKSDLLSRSPADMAPEFQPDEIYGITSGKFTHQEGPWRTTIELKGHQCTYLASHSSGHFRKVVWKKGVGLVEYSAGYGAMADGYRLKRTAARTQ